MIQWEASRHAETVRRILRGTLLAFCCFVVGVCVLSWLGSSGVLIPLPARGDPQLVGNWFHLSDGRLDMYSFDADGTGRSGDWLFRWGVSKGNLFIKYCGGEGYAGFSTPYQVSGSRIEFQSELRHQWFLPAELSNSATVAMKAR